MGFSPERKKSYPPPDGGYPGGNTAEGQNALFSLTSGTYNTAVGFFSLRSNTSGNFNTAIGTGTLLLNTGDENTAIGAAALLSNTTGNYNTATGSQALLSNATGDFNTANGFEALYSNTTGDNNTASGYGALVENTTGQENTATGVAALRNNTTGSFNTASGFEALYNNTTADNNTANGYGALFSNTTGHNNTVIGYRALENSTVGSGNTVLGAFAGTNIGTASNVIAIGSFGENVSDSCYIGNISGATSSGGSAVFINSEGKLGVNTSSRRFKEEIKPMETASETLFSLKPVTFRYNKTIDPKGIAQFGLVAEDVNEINPDLVVRDKNGKINTVRYEAVNAMLLNEFLKEHCKVEEQQVRIIELDSRAAEQEALVARLQQSFESKLAEQEKTIDELTSGLQKVSAQVGVSRPAPQTVVSNH